MGYIFLTEKLQVLYVDTSLTPTCQKVEVNPLPPPSWWLDLVTYFQKKKENSNFKIQKPDDYTTLTK